jgi:hypothetical protein
MSSVKICRTRMDEIRKIRENDLNSVYLYALSLNLKISNIRLHTHLLHHKIILIVHFQ